MYKIKVEVNPHEPQVSVYVEDNVIVFEADTQSEAKKDASEFVLVLLKSTGRLGY